MPAVMACLDEYIGVSNTNMHLGQRWKIRPRPSAPPGGLQMDGGYSLLVSTFQVYRQSVDGDGAPLRRFCRI